MSPLTVANFSTAPPPAAVGSTPVENSAGGFGNHLQRAGQAGDQTAQSPSNTSGSPQPQGAATQPASFNENGNQSTPGGGGNGSSPHGRTHSPNDAADPNRHPVIAPNASETAAAQVQATSAAAVVVIAINQPVIANANQPAADQKPVLPEAPNVAPQPNPSLPSTPPAATESAAPKTNNQQPFPPINKSSSSDSTADPRLVVHQDPLPGPVDSAPVQTVDPPRPTAPGSGLPQPQPQTQPQPQPEQSLPTYSTRDVAPTPTEPILAAGGSVQQSVAPQTVSTVLGPEPENSASHARTFDTLSDGTSVLAAAVSVATVQTSASIDPVQHDTVQTKVPLSEATPNAGAKLPSDPQANNVTANMQVAGTNAGGKSTSQVQSSGSSNASSVDQARFVQRVVRAFQAADEQGGQIRLRLSPPELGSMKIEIALRNGTMTAHVETETSAARNLLLDNLPALRDRLSSHNIKIEQFDINLMNQSRGGNPENPAGQTDPRHQSTRNGITNTTPTDSAATPSAGILGGTNQLNVVV